MPGTCGIDYKPEDSPAQNLWIYGVVLAIAASCFSVLGLNLQRYSQRQNAAKPASFQRPSLRQPLNVIGMILLTLTSIVDLVAYGFAPQSLLAPLGALTLVLNMWLAPLILKEDLSRKDIIGTCMVVVGMVVAVAFGNRHTIQYTGEALHCLLKRAEFIVYAIIMIIWIGALLYGVRHIENGNNEIKTRYFKIHRLMYPALAGTFGGGSVLFGKLVIELIKETILGSNEFTKIGTYLALIAFAASAVLQLRFLNGGLALFESLFIVPVYQVFWVVVGILGGSIYFDEVASYSALQWFMYTFGIVLTVSGVLLLSTRQPQPSLDAPGHGGRRKHRKKVDTAATESYSEYDSGTGMLNGGPRKLSSRGQSARETDGENLLAREDNDSRNYRENGINV